MSTDGPIAGREGWIEVVIAVVLSVAGLATSWSSFQASLWDGEQAGHYSRANALRVLASSAQQEADSHRAIDIGLFNSWLQAKATNDAPLAAFYEDRFPPELKASFQAWIAQTPLKNPNAPKSPFTSSAYAPAGFDKAKRLNAEADQTYDRGQKDNGISDVFTQGTVFFAMALFFAGIGQVFKFKRVRIGLLVIAIISCAIGIANIAALPTLRPG